MVPLKEREMDFLDSSSAGVGSRGAEPTTCGAAGDGTCMTNKELVFNKLKRGRAKEKQDRKCM